MTNSISLIFGTQLAIGLLIVILEGFGDASHKLASRGQLELWVKIDDPFDFAPLTWQSEANGWMCAKNQRNRRGRRFLPTYLFGL